MSISHHPHGTSWSLAKFAHVLAASGASIGLIAGVAALTQAATAPPSAVEIAAASRAERDRELKLLGISGMQPPATAYDLGKPGNANYDESKANPYPRLPDVLIMNDGTRVTTTQQWKKRRAEIKAMFDENIYGKYSAHIPHVTWHVDSVEAMTVFSRRRLAGRARHVHGCCRGQPCLGTLGAKGLGTTTFPPMSTLIDSGDVAFRQHPYGHTPAPNWPYFIDFADREFNKR